MKHQTTELMQAESPNKFKSFMEKVGKRNVIIACAVLLIGAAVWLNFVLFSSGDTGGYDGYDQPSGNISDNLTGNEDGTGTGGSDTSADDTYFSSTLVSRQRARDEALEVLETVLASESAKDEAKAEALADISRIALEIEKEANIETLIRAKGFEECVAVISGESASIIVKGDGDLLSSHVAQIGEIVYEQTGILPVNVKILSK